LAATPIIAQTEVAGRLQASQRGVTKQKAKVKSQIEEVNLFRANELTAFTSSI
jgi:hypothetical protein